MQGEVEYNHEEIKAFDFTNLNFPTKLISQHNGILIIVSRSNAVYIFSITSGKLRTSFYLENIKTLQPFDSEYLIAHRQSRGVFVMNHISQNYKYIRIDNAQEYSFQPIQNKEGNANNNSIGGVFIYFNKQIAYYKRGRTIKIIYSNPYSYSLSNGKIMKLFFSSNLLVVASHTAIHLFSLQRLMELLQDKKEQNQKIVKVSIKKDNFPQQLETIPSSFEINGRIVNFYSVEVQ